MFSGIGEPLGDTVDVGAVHPDTAVLAHFGDGEVHEVLLFRPWCPAYMVNTHGGPFDEWVSLNGTTRLGQFGGGRVFWGAQAFVRQIDITPKHVWLVPLLIQLPTLLGPVAWVCGGETLWSWRSAGAHFYLRGDAVRWSLHGAGNTDTEVLQREQAKEWANPTEFFYSIGAVRLSSGLR